MLPSRWTCSSALGRAAIRVSRSRDIAPAYRCSGCASKTAISARWTKRALRRHSAGALSPQRQIPLFWSLLPIIALASFLLGAMVILPRMVPGFSMDGHFPLVLGTCVAALIARKFGYRYGELEKGMVEGIAMAMPAILILYTIGMLIGVWMSVGIVPALISWGLHLISPSYFLPAACLSCAAISLVTGSSWSTAGTLGVALMGVGQAMGIDPGWAAGAVISGAYVGDKLSPMSETTNLAPAMAGAELFVHIRHMLWTAVPAFVIAMVVYLIFAAGAGGDGDASTIQEVNALLVRDFSPSLLHLAAPLTVLVLVFKKMPALPSLLAGVLVAALVGLASGVGLTDILNAAVSGYVPSTNNPLVDELLKRGGMKSVNDTVLLILCAMSFGGVMEHTGMLRSIAQQVLRWASKARGLVISSMLTSVFLNIFAADQYISIVVPGRMYASAFREKHVPPRNLSRALEDGGTMTSALVPWNSCGAYMAATLGVSTYSYAPYAIVNWITPVLAIFMAMVGVGIAVARSEPDA